MIGMLRTVVLDAPDARRLAAFYTALGGWTEQYADDEWVTMQTGDGWRIAAQRSPDLSYASPGSGSPMHILGEMFNKSAGLGIKHVPYKGVAPAINDVLGGHVPLTVVTYGPIAPYLASGKVTPLAVADKARSPLAPNVPTLAELGYKDIEVVAWNGIFGPKGLSPEIVKTLNGHFNEILKMPDVAAKMAVFGALPLGGTPETLAKTNAADFERFGRVIKELGIQAD